MILVLMGSMFIIGMKARSPRWRVLHVGRYQATKPGPPCRDRFRSMCGASHPGLGQGLGQRSRLKAQRAGRLSWNKKGDIRDASSNGFKEEIRTRI